MTGSRVHHKPGRLVDDQDVLVFVDDVQFDVLRHPLALGFLLGVKRQQGAAMDDVARTHDVAIDGHRHRDASRHASETPAADRHPRTHRCLFFEGSRRRKPQRNRAVPAGAGRPGQPQLYQRHLQAQGPGVAVPVRPLCRPGAAGADLRELQERRARGCQVGCRALYPPASAASERRLRLLPQGPDLVRPGPRPAGALPAAGHDQAHQPGNPETQLPRSPEPERRPVRAAAGRGGQPLVAVQGHPGPDLQRAAAAARPDPRQPGRAEAVPGRQRRDPAGTAAQGRKWRRDRRRKPRSRRQQRRPFLVQLHDLWRIRLTRHTVNEKGRPDGLPFLLPGPKLGALHSTKLDTMVRLILWIALIAAAFWLWRKFKAGTAADTRPTLDDPLKMARQRRFGGRLVIACMLQCAADQNVPVSPWDRVAPLGQHHARQEIFRALEQDHLPFHRLHRQFQAQRAQQVATPGPRRKHHLIGADRAIDGFNAANTLALAAEPGDFTMLAKGHVRQGLQCRLERLDQARVAHVRHTRHVDGPLETRPQHGHRRIGAGHIHCAQRAPLAGRPGQRLGFIVQVQPVQAGGMHLGVYTGAGEQTLAQLRIEVLRPMRQGGNRRAVAPRVQRRHDPAPGPGRLLPERALVAHHHLLDIGRQVERITPAAPVRLVAGTGVAAHTLVIELEVATGVAGHQPASVTPGQQAETLGLAAGVQAVMACAGGQRGDHGVGIGILARAGAVALQVLRTVEQQPHDLAACGSFHRVAVAGVGNARQNADHGDDNQQFDQAQALMSSRHVPAPLAAPARSPAPPAPAADAPRQSPEAAAPQGRRAAARGASCGPGSVPGKNLALAPASPARSLAPPRPAHRRRVPWVPLAAAGSTRTGPVAQDPPAHGPRRAATWFPPLRTPAMPSPGCRPCVPARRHFAAPKHPAGRTAASAPGTPAAPCPVAASWQAVTYGGDHLIGLRAHPFSGVVQGQAQADAANARRVGHRRHPGQLTALARHAQVNLQPADMFDQHRVAATTGEQQLPVHQAVHLLTNGQGELLWPGQALACLHLGGAQAVGEQRPVGRATGLPTLHANQAQAAQGAVRLEADTDRQGKCRGNGRVGKADRLAPQAAECAGHADVTGHALQRKARILLQLRKCALRLPTLQRTDEQTAAGQHQQHAQAQR
uniref:Transposase n=1 Tax=Parastrongyloides trichosuri TaxID=131310 RepID=A0A0N5A5U5_PARTI